jgi:hypothetical protein
MGMCAYPNHKSSDLDMMQIEKDDESDESVRSVRSDESDDAQMDGWMKIGDW